MSFRGADIQHVWVDEMKDHTVDAMNYMLQSQNASLSSFVGATPPLPPWPEVKPLEIPCRACGSGVGERCNRGRDPRTGRVRQRGLHYRRKDDARMATEATRALLSPR